MTARQIVVMVLLLGAQFMLAVDFSILNVALPEIGRGVGLGNGNLQWVATAFALPAAGFTLLFGRVADLVGRRRMFLAGLVLLAAGSLVGGLATTPTVLLTARVVQGLATAIATPAALSLLVTSFPEGPRRDRALGLNGALLSGGFTAGALVGGVLTEQLSWRWAFLVNVPVALAIIVAVPFVVQESRHGARPRLDVPGAITVTAGLLALVYGVVTAGRDGWGDPVALTLLAAAVVLLAAFRVIENRTPEPLASMRVLTRRSVKWGNIGGLTVFAMESAVVFVLTLYLQQVRGYSPMTTGLVFGGPGVVAVATGILAPRWIGRFGARASLVGGLVVQGLSNLALVFLPNSGTGVTVILVALSLGFLGHVSGIVAFTVTATSGLPDEEQGLATGLTTMTQQVAITLGIPILSAVAAARGGGVLAGVHASLLVDALVTFSVAGLLAVFLLGRSERH